MNINCNLTGAIILVVTQLWICSSQQLIWRIDWRLYSSQSMFVVACLISVLNFMFYLKWTLFHSLFLFEGFRLPAEHISDESVEDITAAPVINIYLEETPIVTLTSFLLSSTPPLSSSDLPFFSLLPLSLLSNILWLHAEMNVCPPSSPLSTSTVTVFLLCLLLHHFFSSVPFLQNLSKKQFSLTISSIALHNLHHPTSLSLSPPSSRHSQIGCRLQFLSVIVPPPLDLPLSPLLLFFSLCPLLFFGQIVMNENAPSSFQLFQFLFFLLPKLVMNICQTYK